MLESKHVEAYYYVAGLCIYIRSTELIFDTYE